MDNRCIKWVIIGLVMLLAIWLMVSAGKNMFRAGMDIMIDEKASIEAANQQATPY